MGKVRGGLDSRSRHCHAQLGNDTEILPPRFRISEQHGDQEPKYRIIGDLSRSMANQVVYMSDTYCPQDIDSFVAMVRILSHAGASDLRLWPLDFHNDYKTISLHMDSRDAAHICSAHPVTNKPYTAEILVQPAGSRRDPSNWGRVVTFIQFIARELLTLVVGDFVDDVFCAEPMCVW